MDARLNKRITETSEVVNKRIDDTMVGIKRLFVAIMATLLGSGLGFIWFVVRIYEKMEHLHP